MSDETLMTAAHRLNRFFRIDMQNGGLVVDETLSALQTLTRQIDFCDAAKTRAKVEHVGDTVYPVDYNHDLLLGASRDCVKLLNLDMSKHGGMVSIATEISFDTLVKAIRAAGGRQ